LLFQLSHIKLTTSEERGDQEGQVLHEAFEEQGEREDEGMREVLAQQVLIDHKPRGRKKSTSGQQKYNNLVGLCNRVQRIGAKLRGDACAVCQQGLSSSPPLPSAEHVANEKIDSNAWLLSVGSANSA